MIRPGGKTDKRIKRILWRLPKAGYTTNFGVRLPMKHPAITPPILKDIFFGVYESKEAELVQKKIAADDVVMEVGAGIGFLSALSAKAVGSERVFAYEANPQLMEVIKQVHALNGVAPTVSNVLLGEGEGECDFWLAKDYWASSLIQGSEDATRIRVRQIDLNQEIQRIQPSFMILDIEGGEYEFLRHARLDPIRKIVIEVHPHVLGYARISEMLSWLFAAGFALDLGNMRKHVLYLFKEEVATT
ncbi:MAG: FkbM family methyltransferase [Burkholderiales bacterium]|nr:FkbM family methyltransferase [Burkholderiales bacterium]